MQPMLPGLILQHVGPLPHPQQLAAYEEAHPGAAAWILREAELNSQHFRATETKALNAQRLDNLLHRLLPFGLVLTCLVCCTLIAVLASAAWGTVGFGATITAVMVAYLKNRNTPPGRGSS
jgi:uncharacterized membrane protein